MSILPRLKPRRYYDLVIEVAIVRPGPIQGGMVHPYLARRKDPHKTLYPSPALRQVLERTLGVPIFQEQVMEIAMVAAGFSAGKADQLRRAMAAWKRKGGLEPFRDDLVRGMLANGYDEKFALQIFDQIKGFGEYGFPESHSASFALLVYVSAWLKCYEPAAFTCALLNSQPMGFYAPAQLVQDARRHGVEIRAVDVLESEWECTLEPGLGTQDSTQHPLEGYAGLSESPVLSAECCVLGSSVSCQPAIRLGFRMIKGLSQQGAQRLIAARSLLFKPSSRNAQHAAGIAPDFEHLALRANLSRKDMNALAAAGALESLAGHRREAAWMVAGIEKRPPLLAAAAIIESGIVLASPAEGEDILADYASTGLSLRRHPLALLRPRLNKLSMSTAEALKTTPSGTPVKVAGLVTCRQHPGTAKGVIFVTLEDETGQINVVVWERLSRKQRRPLLASRLLRVAGTLERDGAVIHVIAQDLADYSRLIGQLDARSRDFH
jgi:error-prone DNA polymerase